MLGMSSEKINKHLEGLGGNRIGGIARWDSAAGLLRTPKVSAFQVENSKKAPLPTCSPEIALIGSRFLLTHSIANR
jgi:hypothetical protein